MQLKVNLFGQCSSILFDTMVCQLFLTSGRLCEIRPGAPGYRKNPNMFGLIQTSGNPTYYIHFFCFFPLCVSSYQNQFLFCAFSSSLCPYVTMIICVSLFLSFSSTYIILSLITSHLYIFYYFWLFSPRPYINMCPLSSSILPFLFIFDSMTSNISDSSFSNSCSYYFSFPLNPLIFQVQFFHIFVVFSCIFSFISIAVLFSMFPSFGDIFISFLHYI